MTRVLLTGGSGFIGSRLLTHLHAANIDVLSIGRGELREWASAGIDHRIVPRLDAAHIRETVRDTPIDAVIHLAAAGVNPGERDSDELHRINEHLPAELVALAQAWGARAFLMSGTNSEYARFDGDRISENAPLETTKLYGATKAAGALLAISTAFRLGLPAVNLRLFNVFGPGEAPHRLLPALCESLLANSSVSLSEGLQVRDFVHVDDACRAILCALSGVLEGTLPSGHYNVCSGEATSVRAFALSVARALRADAALLRFGALPLRPDDQPRVVGDPTIFASHTGWEPRASVIQGIADTIFELSHVKSAETP